MTRPFDKSTNLGIEISSKPAIQTMPTPVDNLIADQSKRKSHHDPEQKIPAPVDTDVKNKDLRFFKDKINPNLTPSGDPSPSSHKEIASVQKNTYRGFNRS
jgi:hypothetical protein